MGTDTPIDELITHVTELDRPQCIAHLRRFSQPKLDFSDDFLCGQSLEQLRHLLLAACLQARKRGDGPYH